MKLRYIITLLIMLAIPVNSSADDRALLIGIDRYEHCGPTLQGAENDVGRIMDFLLSSQKYSAGQIQTLLNEEATKANIMKGLKDWLVKGSASGDRIFLYYSGHGYFQPDTDGDEPDRQDETLVSYNTLQKDDGSFVNMVTDDEIGAILEQINDRKVVVVIDSCHSGTMTRDLEGTRTLASTKVPVFAKHHVRPVTKGRFRSTRQEESFVKTSTGRVVWSAVSASQSAFENSEITPRNGVFTNAFLNGLQKGLADSNGNGRITRSELLDYLQAESESYCERHRECKLGLTPTLEASPDKLATPVFSFEESHANPQTSSTGQATDILAHDNSAAISLEISPADRLKLGQKIQFTVSSPVDGYLIVLDINANNQVTQIFPNKYSDRAGRGNKITAGVPVVIPNSYYGFELPAGEPVGTGLLLAIITEDPVPLDDLLADRKDLQIIKNSNTYLTALAARLRATWRQDRYNRRLRWSLVEHKYNISK